MFSKLGSFMIFSKVRNRNTSFAYRSLALGERGIKEGPARRNMQLQGRPKGIVSKLKIKGESGDHNFTGVLSRFGQGPPYVVK